MIIKSKTGAEFEMNIAGYQFPDMKLSDETRHDLNWLNIHIRIGGKTDGWEKTDPALETGEVKWLIDWLKAIAANDLKELRIDFMESCLSFEILPSKNEFIRLVVCFDMEFTPPWNCFSPTEKEPLYLLFILTREDIEKAAEELQADLDKFPYRPMSENDKGPGPRIKPIIIGVS